MKLVKFFTIVTVIVVIAQLISFYVVSGQTRPTPFPKPSIEKPDAYRPLKPSLPSSIPKVTAPPVNAKPAVPTDTPLPSTSASAVTPEPEKSPASTPPPTVQPQKTIPPTQNPAAVLPSSTPDTAEPSVTNDITPTPEFLFTPEPTDFTPASNSNGNRLGGTFITVIISLPIIVWVIFTMKKTAQR